MDVRKGRSHLKRHQTPEPHLQKSHVPDTIGTWSLRNREQLKKRKAEAQGRQMSQWVFGEQKKRKYQRTGKGIQRGQKRQGNVEQKAEPCSQTEKERVQEVLVPAEEETEHPGSPATEVLPLVASPTKPVPAEHCSEVHQESIQCQEIAIQNHSQTHQHSAKAEDFSPTTCQEIAVFQHSTKMCQDVAEPEALSPKMYQETTVSPNQSSEVPQGIAEPEAFAPKMCQETTVPQYHSSKVPQDMAGPEAFAPKMCQEPTVFQEHTLKMCQDVVRPEVLSPKTHQEMTIPQTLPCLKPEDAAGPEGYFPEALPESDVPEGCPLDTTPTSVTSEKNHPDLGMDVTEGSFSEARECTGSEAIGTKTHQEAVEAEFIPQETYKEVTIVSSHKTILESPGPEEYLPETCQPAPGPENYPPETGREMSGPEDLSIKTCENRDGPKHSLPEGAQEVGGAQGQDPDAQDSENTGAFSQEMEEEDEADQDPETPSRPVSSRDLSREWRL